MFLLEKRIQKLEALHLLPDFLSLFNDLKNDGLAFSQIDIKVNILLNQYKSCPKRVDFGKSINYF